MTGIKTVCICMISTVMGKKIKGEEKKRSHENETIKKYGMEALIKYPCSLHVVQL